MKLVAFGDVIINNICINGKKDVEKHIPSAILQKLRNADIAFCNLETPLTTSTEKQNSHYSKLLDAKKVFVKTPPRCAEFLSYVGFDIVSIANNHIIDYKEKGLNDTIKALETHHIKHVGAGHSLLEARRPVVIKKNGTKIGFLAYSYTYEATHLSAGAAPLWPSLIKEDIRALNDSCDIIVVSIHYGEDYVGIPSNKEIKLFHSLIDEGAGIILGHHPHFLRPIETYKCGLIAYGLGNFIIDYSHFTPEKLDKKTIEKCRESMILEMDFEKNRLKDWKIHPIYLDELGFPSIPSDKIKHTILNNVRISNEDVGLEGTVPVSNINKYCTKRLKQFLRLFTKSIYDRNLTNIYLLLMRFFHGG